MNLPERLVFQASYLVDKNKLNRLMPRQAAVELVLNAMHEGAKIACELHEEPQRDAPAKSLVVNYNSLLHTS